MLKPILFNTEMVRAILDGRKTETRRPVKQKYSNSVLELIHEHLHECEPKTPDVINEDGSRTCRVRAVVPCKAPYQSGDILYVRETWIDWGCEYCDKECFGNCNPPNYAYRATGDWDDWEGIKWKPSIHMPREAARIFLKVTEVRVERVQDITPKSACGEGVTHILNPGHPLREKAYARGHWDEEAQDWFAGSVHAFAALWDSVYKNWSDNPWVWVIKFERCTKGGEKIA